MTSPISISENSYHSRSFDPVLRFSRTTGRGVFGISRSSWIYLSSPVYGFFMLHPVRNFPGGISNHSSFGSTDGGNSHSSADRPKYFLCTDGGKSRGFSRMRVPSFSRTSRISHSRTSKFLSGLFSRISVSSISSSVILYYNLIIKLIDIGEWLSENEKHSIIPISSVGCIFYNYLRCCVCIFYKKDISLYYISCQIDDCRIICSD